MVRHGELGGRDFRSAVSCLQKVAWWIQTEGGMLHSKNGKVLPEGRGQQDVLGGGAGGGGGGLRKVGGGLEATAFVSMLASSVSSRVLWLSCNMLWNVDPVTFISPNQ